MYGIIVVNLSMLSTIVTGLAIDAKGPISDMLVKLLDFWSNYAKKYYFFKQVGTKSVNGRKRLVNRGVVKHSILQPYL